MQGDKSGGSSFIENFIDQVKWLQEPEFGDFKRKVGLYVNRLEEELSSGALSGTSAGQKQRDLLEQMRFVCLYAPDGDMDGTRRKVLQLAEQLKGAS